MSSPSKVRGYQVEKWLERKHKENGIDCERVPLSGSMGGKYSGDLAIPNVERRAFVCESKARRDGTGFKVIEGWLEEKDILFIKRNNQNPMIVLSWETYLKLMKVYMDNEQSRNPSV